MGSSLTTTIPAVDIFIVTEHRLCEDPHYGHFERTLRLFSTLNESIVYVKACMTDLLYDEDAEDEDSYFLITRRQFNSSLQDVVFDSNHDDIS